MASTSSPVLALMPMLDRSLKYQSTVIAWLATGGDEGLEPTGPAKTLLEIYERGVAEADTSKRHELVGEAVRVHVEEGPFLIGACGDIAMPVVIADDFRGVPDLVILGPWSAGTPGNLHPEQFWIEP